MKPTSVTEFLNDDRVQNIIDGGGLKIGYERPEDFEPALEWNKTGTGAGTKIAEGSTVTVSMGDIVHVTITNASVYDGGIKWYRDGGAVALVTNGVFTVDTTGWNRGSHVTVEAVKGGISYSILFFLAVE